MKSPRVLLTIALAILLTLMLVSIVYAVVCPKCGNENQDNAKFCSECGTPLTSGREPLGQVSLEVVKVKGRRVGGTMAVTRTMRKPYGVRHHHIALSPLEIRGTDPQRSGPGPNSNPPQYTRIRADGTPYLFYLLANINVTHRI